ncbi:MAG: hypothetical protein JJ863_26575 [Deltaproteobacteria bacterium]|nr:hypothetical protein [Deltaproteobacteria bacterium]
MRSTLVFSILCAAATASAQAGEEAYQRGVAALEEGDTEGAVDAFREAFATEPNPRHALALAATYQQRGDFPAALGLYDRLLEGDVGELSERQGEAVREARDAAVARVVTLEVSTADDRAMTLEVDGRASGRVTADAPLLLRLDPGQHRVRGLGDDESVSETLLIDVAAGGRREVTLTLGEAPEPEADEPVVEPTEPPPARPVGPWIVLAAAGLPLALGIVGGVLHNASLDDADLAPSQVEAAPFIDDARRFGRVATTGFVLAGAFVVAGVVWAIVAGRRSSDGSARLRMGRVEF